jgi:hypothetical protein
MKTIDYLDVTVECPKHESAFDCTPFCGICEGSQEVSMDQLLSQADTVAWDTCHKIYLNMNSQQTDKMIEYGYSNIVGGSFHEKQDAVFKWYEDSCGLRFIDAVFSDGDSDKFVVVVGQFFGDDEEEDEDDGSL